MPINDVNERIFDDFDAVQAVAGFEPSDASAELGFLSEVFEDNSEAWKKAFVRCLNGEKPHIYILVDPDPAPSGKLVVSQLYVPGEADRIAEFQAAFGGGSGEMVTEDVDFGADVAGRWLESERKKDHECREPHTFDFGEAVFQTLSTLNKIVDATPRNRLLNYKHSARDIAKMAVRKSLEKQWPPALGDLTER
jgi:hypothetical protein